MKLQIFLAGLLMASAAQLAQAEDSQHYVALSYDFNEVNGLPEIDGVNNDDKDEGFTATYGYQFEERFAVEIFFTDAGTVEQTGDGFSGEVDIDGYGIGLKFDFINDQAFDFYGKLGYARHNIDTSAIEEGLSVSVSDSESDFFYGIGIDFGLSSDLSLRGEYGQFEVGDEDYSSFKIGLVYGF